MSPRPDDRMRAAPSRRALLALGAGGVASLALPFAARAGAPRRLVIAGGDLTEIAFALGAGDQVAATDTTSLYPEAVAALPKIGYLRTLAPEGILSMAPDLVVVSAEAGPPATLDRLREAGVEVAVAPEGLTAEVVPKKIAFMGEVLGREAEAATLIERFEAQMAALAVAMQAVEDRPAVLCLLSAGRGAPIAAGRGTAAAAMIDLAGGRNAVQGYPGYKPLSAESAIAAAPEAILVPDHAAAFMGGREAVLAMPALAPTPAGQSGNLLIMDGLALLGFGPRTPRAAADLAEALHPGLVVELPK